MIKTYIDGVLQESGGLPPTPTNPTTKFLNGNVEWAEISVGSGGYASDLYFTETNSTINPAYKQISYINQPTQVIKSVVVNNSESLIQAYIFDSPIGITQVDAGSWTGSLFSYVSASGGISTLKIEVYSRTVGGVETLLFEKYSNEINNTTGEYIKTETVQPVFTVNATDYLVVKVYGKTTATANRTISYVIGDGSASYINTSLALRHNQLRGLNDDVNFQHITATDRTKLNNLSGTNTGDETASTIINKIGDGSKINSNYLPSYVDDVLEFANVASFPATGETGKIYIALDVNLTYRWSGSGYVEISPSIALGETSATAYRGDRGASAYAHSILTSGTNPHNTTFANIASKPTTIAGYGITDGVTLVGSETLTNKTLTAPVLNTEITGTGITTTGEENKLVKVNSSGTLILKGTDSMRSGITGAVPIFVMGNINNSVFLNKVYSPISIALAGIISVGKSRGGAVGTEATTLAGDALGYYVFEGVGSGNAPAVGASIEAEQSGTAGASYIPADIFFKTCTATTQNTVMSLKSDKTVQIPSLAGTGNRMVVADSSGNLSANGINTYTPTLAFQVGQVGSFTQICSGSYIITGNMVKVIFSVDATALPSAGSFLSITLPIARKAGTTLSGYFSRYNGINVSTTADFIGLCNYGSDLTSAWFIKSKNDGTGGLNGISVSELSSVVSIQGVIEYEI